VLEWKGPFLYGQVVAWISRSLGSHEVGLGGANDPNNPPEKGRRSAAVGRLGSLIAT
jgi:hypothetical protein